MFMWLRVSSNYCWVVVNVGGVAVAVAITLIARRCRPTVYRLVWFEFLQFQGVRAITCIIFFFRSTSSCLVLARRSSTGFFAPNAMRLLQHAWFLLINQLYRQKTKGRKSTLRISLLSLSLFFSLVLFFWRGARSPSSACIFAKVYV